MPPPSPNDTLACQPDVVSPTYFFCWSCGVKLAADDSMRGMSGPCPQCRQMVTAPGTKTKPSPGQYFRDDDGLSGPGRAEKPSLQIEVIEETERSPHILPGLLPTKIGDVILPAFRVIKRKSRWVVLSIALVAMAPFLWLACFFFPETQQLLKEFNAFRLKQIEFVERQIRSSREAQAILDRQAKLASHEPKKPLARSARAAVAEAPPPPSQAPASAPPSARPTPPSPSPTSPAASLAAPSLEKTQTASVAPLSPAPAQVAPSVSPYVDPPEDPVRASSSTVFAGRPEDKKEWPQILLRNNGIFAGHTPARGTCSFLVDGGNGSLWLSTAAQLLGTEGGVHPPINPARLSTELYLWRAYYPGDESSFVDAVGGSSLVSVVSSGWLGLKLASAPALLPASPVKLRHNPPAAGETVYLVGLPYDDRTGASQHLYAGTVTAAQQEDPSLFGFTLQVPFKLTGFTGAPIVDVRGEVVGVLSGGHTSLLVGTKADRLEAMIHGK